MFKWGVEMMLIRPEVWQGLQAVAGLQAGRGKGRESKNIEPVPLEIVEATIKHMPGVFADIAKVQLHSGARAGEILIMRTCDIDQAGDVWKYTPSVHKNAWRGQERRVVLGPMAQTILQRYLRFDNPEEYVFKPGMARKRRQNHLRPHYQVCEYDKAIGRACKKAKVPHWSSHQLRRLAAQSAEREIGTEAARAYLGHKSVNMAAHYSGIDLKAAAEVAKRIG
jgi:integrase